MIVMILCAVGTHVLCDVCVWRVVMFNSSGRDM